VNLAYIVSAYKLPDQLVRLVSTLDTGDSHFLVHVDKKTDDEVFRRMTAPLRDHSNVHFLERHRCFYGGFGHVKATLKGIDEIVRQRLPFDYVILLTGQDYPIKSNRQIEEFFSRHEGRSFMEYFSMPSDGWVGGSNRGTCGSAKLISASRERDAGGSGVGFRLDSNRSGGRRTGACRANASSTSRRSSAERPRSFGFSSTSMCLTSTSFTPSSSIRRSRTLW
jgi:hypothetical protein